MDIGDLGPTGEDFFSTLCSSVGLVANPSIKDKFGWDFIVQTDLPSSTEAPSDSDGLPFECKVQVKSTNERRGKWQIKVSNMKRN